MDEELKEFLTELYKLTAKHSDKIAAGDCGIEFIKLGVGIIKANAPTLVEEEFAIQKGLEHGEKLHETYKKLCK